MNNLGSSETTREAPLSRNFNFSQYILPAHKKELNSSFLEWFIGLAEGDGCFVIRTDMKSGPLCFELVQKDAQLIYKIRNGLGYGKVSQVRDVYWKFAVSDKKGLERLISLFSGNLVLPKRVSKFYRWVKRARDLGICSQEVLESVKQKSHPVSFSLEDAWLSGLIESEGYFYANFRTKTPPSQIPKLGQKFHITQQDLEGERAVLEKIGILFQSAAKVSTAKQPNVYRLEMCSLKSARLVIEYLERFPLKGKKHIAFKKWSRVYRAREQKEHLTEKGIVRIKRICRFLNKQNALDTMEEKTQEQND